MADLNDLYKQLAQMAKTRNVQPPAVTQGSSNESPLSQVLASFKPQAMSTPVSSSPVAPVAPMMNSQGAPSGAMSYQPSAPPTGNGQVDPAQMAAGDTSGLMPMLKKYWPVLVASLAAAYDRKHQQPHGQAAMPALPADFTRHLSEIPPGHYSTPQPAQPPPSFYTYGEIPDHSSFSPAVMAKGGSTGSSDSPLSQVARYVPGQGSDGRADDVNAKLSNNEYVMDAETVAMLGNGSPDAGAKKLDRMRSNIRKHKGKNLARGKISPDAHEDASNYLSGG